MELVKTKIFNIVKCTPFESICYGGKNIRYSLTFDSRDGDLLAFSPTGGTPPTKELINAVKEFIQLTKR